MTTISEKDELLRDKLVAYLITRAPSCANKSIASVRPPINAQWVIDTLKSASHHPKGSLAALGMTKTPLSSPQMTMLMNVMVGTVDKNITDQDSLYIFDSIAKAIEFRGISSQRDLSNQRDLMKLVMLCPSWRSKAVALHPEIFRTASTCKKTICTDALWRKNAYVCLATTEAPSTSREQIVQMLQSIQSIGINPLQKSKDGTTILHVGASSKNPNLMSAFIELAPTLIDASDLQRNTPLHIACATGVQSNVLALIEAGADPNALKIMGDSALDEAVKNKNMQTIVCFCTHAQPSYITLKRARSWSTSREIDSYLDAQMAGYTMRNLLNRSKKTALFA